MAVRAGVSAEELTANRKLSPSRTGFLPSRNHEIFAQPIYVMGLEAHNLTAASDNPAEVAFHVYQKPRTV